MPVPIDPESRIKDLETSLARVERDLETAREERDLAQAVGREKDARISLLEPQLAAAVLRIVELERALSEIKGDRPKMRVDELARQLGQQLEALNTDAQRRTKEGASAIGLDRIDVEIKGGIDLKDGVQLTELLAQEVSPQTVSTVKFTLYPMRSVRIVDEMPQ
jgi:uncharacterized coiled-coil protein SlyX